MQTEISDLYKLLTGGKVLSGAHSIISEKDFTSIMRDRFISELSKRGIEWNGDDISLELLCSNNKTGSTVSISSPVLESANILNKQDVGVGIDIQLISEMPETNDYWDDEFYKTKFTREEIGYCLNRKNPLESFAGIYACKEAILKADSGVQFNQINIIHNAANKPAFGNFHISISHSGDYVIALAIINIQHRHINNNPSNINSTAAFSDSSENLAGIKKVNFIFYLLILVVITYIILRDFVR